MTYALSRLSSLADDERGWTSYPTMRTLTLGCNDAKKEAMGLAAVAGCILIGMEVGGMERSID